MNIVISTEALNWFKDEMNLQKGDYVKFHARYGGESPIQQGFSLGISTHEPHTKIAAGNEQDGILFYVSEEDLWYFDGHDLQVDLNEKSDELEFTYIENIQSKE